MRAPVRELALVLALVTGPHLGVSAQSRDPGFEPLDLAKARPGSPGSADPLWASTWAATAPDGTVDWELLGERAVSVCRSVGIQPALPVEVVPTSPRASGVFYERTPSGEVVVWLRYGPGSHDNPGGRWKTLREVADLARGIYVGRIVGIEEGFLDGDVGSLLHVRIERVLLASEEHRITGKLYLYWPEARFSIGSLHFWKANPDYPARPEVGARILVVADGRYPPDLARRLVLPRPEAVFVEPPAGGLEHSELAATSPGKSLRSLDAVSAELDRLLAAE